MNDILWHAAEAAAATQGISQNDWSCTGISIDSRSLTGGDLFIAIKGPSFDGHRFVRQALDNGAAACVVDHIPQDCKDTDALLIVPDTTQALNDLGLAARARSNARFVGVTGSVGKTGVKEALAFTLSRQGKTHATLGNLNNHFGLPLTLARMPKDCDYAVLELGMNHAGELTALSAMAQPHVAIITTVVGAHLEYFGSVDAIADAKAEIFSGLVEGGFAIMNADNAYYNRIRPQAAARGDLRLLSFGHADGCQFKAISAKAAPCCGTFVRAEINGQLIDYTVSHPGDHWVNNSLGVLACLYGLGADVQKGAGDLALLPGIKGRGQTHDLSLPQGHVRLIDESYNANDASMRAALAVLSQASAGRKIAVLGDMLELGAEAEQVHKNLKDAFDGIDLLYACGPLMKHLFDALPAAKQGAYRDTAADLSGVICTDLRDGDVVSIKSSNGSKTGLIVQDLLNLQERNER